MGAEVTEVAADATARAAAGEEAAAALLAAPKRRRAAGGTGLGQRTETMAALNAEECDCREVKGCRPPPRSRASSVHDFCAYYGAASSAAAAGADGGAPGRPRLYSFDDAPAVLRYNKYIRSGYRAGLSPGQCCASVLQLHNETGNIWSHLLPPLLLAGAALAGQLQAWEGAAAHYTITLLSLSACFLGSVVYHTFMAHHHHHDSFLKMDICGILLVLLGGGHLVVFWGLACAPAARNLLAVCYYTAGAASLWTALRARTALARGLPLLALLAVRGCVYAARLWLEGGGTPGGGAALKHYLAMEACSVAGGFINVLRLPERWMQPEDPHAPAPCDYWLNSHQIMHLMAVLSMYHLWCGACEDHAFMNAISTGDVVCPAPTLYLLR